MMRRALGSLYAALLYAYPADLRRVYGAAMRQCGRDALARRGAAAMLGDLVVSVPREWCVATRVISK